MLRAPARPLLVLLAIAVGCASGGSAPGPVSEAPAEIEGEPLRGPVAGAEVVDAAPAALPEGTRRLDWNGDQHVDREEFRNYFTRAFHHADADDDRLLRGDELAKLPAGTAQQADGNGDGALDVDEYVDLTLVWFTACDRNADDVLGPDEEQSCGGTEAAPR